MSEPLLAGSVEELHAAGYLVVDSDRGELCVVTDGVNFYALDNFCSHMGSEIHRGIIEDGNIVCPWHRARFMLATGKSLDLYASDISSYKVTIEDGALFVDTTAPVSVQAD